LAQETEPLRDFLKHKIVPLSYRASKGFLTRFRKSTLRKNQCFVDAMGRVVERYETSLPMSPSAATTHKMGSIRQSDTNIESKLFHALRSCKITFEKNTYAIAGLKTKPDVVFRKRKLAVYIDGCFWHSCPYHATQPRSNSSSWQGKLQRNVLRDVANAKALRSRGWRVLRFWGHQDPSDIVNTIKTALGTA
jgi:DNA mismatch endonuclease (patch repair protein)